MMRLRFVPASCAYSRLVPAACAPKVGRNPWGPTDGVFSEGRGHWFESSRVHQHLAPDCNPCSGDSPARITRDRLPLPILRDDLVGR